MRPPRERGTGPGGPDPRPVPTGGASDFRRLQSAAMRVGDLEIHPVHDGWARLPAGDLLRFTGDRSDPWLPHEQFIGADGSIDLPPGGFLVRTGDRVLVIDAAAGRIDTDSYQRAT